MTYTIAGLTKDSNGNVLSNCKVFLFKKSDNSYQQSTTSDGSGNYSFTVADTTTPYFIVCINALVGDSALKLWLRLDEGSGNTLNDDSGNSNTGTNHGATWVTGKYGKALSFDGSDDYVEVARNSSIEPSSAITLSVWIYPTSKTGENNWVIIAKDYTSWGEPYYSYHLRLYGSAGIPNQILFYLNLDGTRYTLYVSGLTLVNAWHHIVATYDGTTMRLYLDSVPIGTPTTQSGTITYYNTNLEIGQFLNSSIGFFSGVIDEIHIYSRALTQTEITTIYNNPPCVVGVSDSNLYGA